MIRHSGMFKTGNKAAVGHRNPWAKRALILKKTIQNTLSRGDVREIVTVLIRQAKSGDYQSIRTLFDYAIGKPDTVQFEPTDEVKISIDDSLAKSIGFKVGRKSGDGDGGNGNDQTILPAIRNEVELLDQDDD